MALEVGSIVEGTVSGIAKFGAFVELPENKVGLVHISEVANEYVSDVAQYLKVKDTVKVKVISIDAKGKIALSVKQAQPKTEEKKEARFPKKEGSEHRFQRKEGFEGRAPRHEAPRMTERRPCAGGYRSQRHEAPASFEDKLNRFLKDSDERLLDLKRNVESKRGGRGGRHSD